MGVSCRQLSVPLGWVFRFSAGLAIWAMMISVSWGQGLAAYGFSDDRAGVESVLRVLADDEEQTTERYRALLQRLDHEDFEVREVATLELSMLPVIDRVALDTIQAGVAPEASMRVARALRTNTEDRYDEVLESVLGAIIDEQHKGLCDLLFRALARSVKFKRSAKLALTVSAVAATAEAGDYEMIVEQLKNGATVVRAVAASVVYEVGGEAAIGALVAATEDPNDDVKWAAAAQLKAIGRPECLKPMAGLLMSKDFGLRSRAVGELRKITAQDFEYYSAGDAEERAKPAAKWLEWIEKEAPDAELNFGEVKAAGVQKPLFDGDSLEGWTEVVEEKEKHDVMFSSWVVNDSGLSCLGVHPGRLQSDAVFEDYELTLEYRFVADDCAGGVGIFCDMAPPRDGYLEIQLKHGSSGNLFRYGDLELHQDDGTPMAFFARKTNPSNEKRDEWNTLSVEVRSGNAVIKVNGLEQNRVGSKVTRPMGLLFRDVGSAMSYRNIQLRTL